MGGTAIIFKALNGATSKTAGEDGGFQGYTDSYQPLKPCASWCALDEFAEDVATVFGVDNSKQTVSGSDVTNMSSIVAATTELSEYGGICGRVLRIDGLLQTYDELHNRQYGTIQEIWVQLQYAYQESLDNANRTTSIAVCNKFKDDDTTCRDGVRKVQSPFPNVFFSAPEVVDIRGFCPPTNMKCRGYMTDQHQPYGGSRSHAERVHWNGKDTRLTIKQWHSEQINSELVDKEPDMVRNNPAVTGLWIVTTEEIQNGLGIIIHTPVSILMVTILLVSIMVVENRVPNTLAVIIIIHHMILEIKLARSKLMKQND